MNNNSKKYLLLVVLLGAIVVGAIFYLFQYRTGELTVLNPNPYEVLMAVRYEQSNDNYVTEGWFKLDPGEKKTFSISFYGINPNFFVYGESNDPDLIRWLPNSLPAEQEAKVFFDTEDGISGSLPKNRRVEGESATSSEEIEEFNFSRVDIAENNTLHILADPFFENVMLNEFAVKSENTEQFFVNIEKNAKSLSASLNRQQEYDRRFPNPESSYPFLFEFSMIDEPQEDGFLRPGVRLTEVDGATIFDDPVQLRKDDILIALNDVEIYAEADAFVELYRHAMNEKSGITVPLKFSVIRGEELFEIESNYLFNPGFPWSETPQEAVLYNLGNSATLGFFAELKALFSDESYEQSKWQTVQKFGRFRQFFPDQAFAGEVAGFFLPSPLTILKLGKVAKGAKAASYTSTALKIASIEMAEVAIYTYKTASPKRTQAEIISDIAKFAVPTAIVGVVAGRFVHGGTPTYSGRASKPLRRYRRR